MVNSGSEVGKAWS